MSTLVGQVFLKAYFDEENRALMTNKLRSTSSFLHIMGWRHDPADIGHILHHLNHTLTIHRSSITNICTNPTINSTVYGDIGEQVTYLGFETDVQIRPANIDGIYSDSMVEISDIRFWPPESLATETIKKCCCGSAAIGFSEPGPRHSDWCDVYCPF